MKIRFLAIAFVIFIYVAGAHAQGGDGKPDVKEQFAQLKQSMAENKARLQNYQWLETTEVSIKGDTKKDEQKACHYGPDGKVVKTLLGPEAAPKEPPGGLKGKIVKKKMAEMKDYSSRLKGLISHYVPPDPERLQASFQAGKANLNMSSAGGGSLIFSDYYKPGDKVTIGFDTTTKKLTNYDVNTYLDGTEDVVTLTNQFSTLPDATNYLQQTVLSSKSKQIEIKTSNSNYGPVNQ